MTENNFILASSSPQRRQLLAQIGYVPEEILPADIDESEKPLETATAYVKRMAREKAERVAALRPGKVVLAADTVVVCGTKILHKAANDAEQQKVMEALNGKAHRVISSVCVVSADGTKAQRTVSTRIVVKKFSDEEIKDYVASREWVGCCGYKIEGRMAAYIVKMIGSYSGVVGLPLLETRNLLIGAGIK